LAEHWERLSGTGPRSARALTQWSAWKWPRVLTQGATTHMLATLRREGIRNASCQLEFAGPNVFGRGPGTWPAQCVTKNAMCLIAVGLQDLLAKSEFQTLGLKNNSTNNETPTRPQISDTVQKSCRDNCHWALLTPVDLLNKNSYLWRTHTHTKAQARDLPAIGQPLVIFHK
jgi:hypothetical protein